MSSEECVWTQFEAVARRRGDAIAMRHGTDAISFEALFAASRAFASDLEAVQPGDRVVICGANSTAIPALVAGIWARGGIPVLVHSEAPPQHLLHAIDRTNPVAVYTDREEPEQPGETWQRQIAWPAEPSMGIDPAGVLRSGDEAASIVFTSGSSGPPKGVVQSSRNLVDGARRMTALMSYTEGDSILCPIPFAFDYGWGQVLSLLLEGVPLVLPEPRNAFGLCDALRDHAPTVLAAVPAVLGELVAGLAPINETPCESIRLITSTGSKMPAGTLDTAREHFRNAEISLNYGMTETYRTASLPPRFVASHPTAVGHAVEGVTLMIRRQDGTDANPGEEGEILHRGAGCFLGYWDDPARTAEVLSMCPETGQSVVRTGDLGRIDENGFLYVHGRRDRQLKSMGVRVAPDEIESLLLESELLSAVAVTSVPHDIVGDFIVACVVPRDRDLPEKALLKALRAHSRARMSAHMQPRRFVVLATLPSTPSAKIDYPRVARLVRESA